MVKPSIRFVMADITRDCTLNIEIGYLMTFYWGYGAFKRTILLSNIRVRVRPLLCSRRKCCMFGETYPGYAAQPSDLQ